MQRCELSELPVDQCACRTHGPQESARPARPLLHGHAFPARFAGQCKECQESIAVGEQIVASPLAGGGYVHEECS